LKKQIINFNPFPEIITERFKLRQLNKSDSEKIFEIRSNISIAQYLDRPLATSINDAISFIEKISDGISKNQVIYWGIENKSTQEIIGTKTLWQISVDGSQAEIGFELFPIYQGKGVMQEVLPVVIHFAFNSMKLSKIEGEVAFDNLKSIKLMEKFGFVYDRKLENTLVYILKEKALTHK